MDYLDEIDWKILAALQQNANLPNTELADRIHLTPAPCLRRVKRLSELGVIQGCNLAINNRQLGFIVSAMVEITLTQQTPAIIENFLKLVQTRQEVIGCHFVTGEFDFMLRVASRTIEGYYKLLYEDLHAVAGIQRIRSSIILATYKDQLSPTLNEAPRASRLSAAMPL